MQVFWLVLALFYLVLAIVTYLSSKTIKKNLEILAQEGPDSSLETKEGKEISLNENLYRAYKAIIITDTIGFVLAAAATAITVSF